MTKFTEEQLEFLQEYIELDEDEEGLPCISKVKCSIKGNVEGDVFGYIGGSLWMKIGGNAVGDFDLITGDFSIEGKVWRG